MPEAQREVERTRQHAKTPTESIGDCFVISPFGRNNADPLRKRVNYVIDKIITPACERHQLRPFSQMSKVSESISQDILSTLDRAELVVAYLPHEPDQDPSVISPNVMYEMGYRCALAKPLILLTDSKVIVPFNVANKTKIEVPSKGEVRSVVKELSDQIGQVMKPPMASDGLYPLTIVLFFNSYAEVELKNDSARRLFGIDQGRRARWKPPELNAQLQRIMSKTQYDAWNHEQNALINLILTRESEGTHEAVCARVPIVIEKNADVELVGQAYLPVICSCRNLTSGNREVQVIYHRVTELVARNGDGVLEFDSSADRERLLWDIYSLSFDVVVREQDYYKKMIAFHVRNATEYLPDNAKVFDAGCGTGNLTEELVRLGHRVLAADASPQMLRLAREKVQKQCGASIDPLLRVHLAKWSLQDAEDFPIPDGSLDGLFVLMTLFAIPRAQDILPILLRKVKRGGIVSITEPKASFDLSGLRTEAEALARKARRNAEFEEHWQRVCQLNERLAEIIASRRMTAEIVLEKLKEQGFDLLEAPMDSHFGQCASIVARKRE